MTKPKAILITAHNDGDKHRVNNIELVFSIPP